MNYKMIFAIFACLMSCELFSADHHVDPLSSSEVAAASIDLEEQLRPYRDARVLDFNFLKGYQGKELDLSSLTRVKKISNTCLFRTSDLERIIFPPNVEEIGKEVLFHCENLRFVDLSGLKALKTIDSFFLFSCKTLTSVNLSGLTRLERIGKYFLNQCSNLTYVNLSDLPMLTELPEEFLFGCINLTSVKLSRLTRLKRVGESFLGRCKSLTSIDISGLPCLKEIGSSFLSGCTSLTSIDLSGLRNLTKLPDAFLSGCTSLTSIDLSELPCLKEIGLSFLCGCTSLTSIDLSGLQNLTELPEGFLYGCTSLASVDLSMLHCLKKIGKNFLSQCNNLTSVDLSGLRNITELPEGFLLRCINLKEVDFSMLKKVVIIQCCILYENTIEHLIISSGCFGLFRVLRSCPRIPRITCELDVLDDGTILYPDPGQYQVITEITQRYLRYSVTIKLDRLRPRKLLWKDFLRDCARVRNLNLAPLEHVKTITDGFLIGCRSLEELEI
ncbi:MAG: hypothetical protein HEEMFOPI_00710 [Holosporales bacterium]